MECTKCGGSLKDIPAGVSKKTGKPYNAFQVCENRCKQDGRLPYPKPRPGALVPLENDFIQLVLEELQAFQKHFDERMDNLATYLIKKFDK